MTFNGNVAEITALNATAGDVVKAIIVNNKDDAAYVVNSSTTQNGILIATGDVQVSGSAVTAWNGLIICNGTLTLSGGTSGQNQVLRNDPDSVGKAMQLICCVGSTEIVDGNAGNYAVMNFFKGGGNFTIGESSNAENAKVDVRECISFENWKAE